MINFICFFICSYFETNSKASYFVFFIDFMEFTAKHIKKTIMKWGSLYITKLFKVGIKKHQNIILPNAFLFAFFLPKIKFLKKCQ